MQQLTQPRHLEQELFQGTEVVPGWVGSGLLLVVAVQAVPGGQADLLVVVLQLLVQLLVELGEGQGAVREGRGGSRAALPRGEPPLVLPHLP